MKNFLLLLSCVLIAQVTEAQVVFEKLYQISPNVNNLKSHGVSLVETSDGGFIVGGNTKNSTGSDRIYIMKINSNGDSLWSKTYSYTGFVQAFAKKVFYNKKGNLTLFANVTRTGSGAWAYFFELNDTNGDTIKVSKFQTSNGYVVDDVVQLSDSGYVFTANNTNTTSRIYRVNKNMVQQWYYQPFPPLLDTVPINALFNGIVNRGDSLYISGRLGYGGAVETYFSKWNIDGTKTFIDKYGFGSYLSMNDMELSDQNYALLVGNVLAQTTQFVKTDAFAVLKLSLTGDSLDLVTFDGPVTDNAYNITKANNGKFLVTGLGSESINGDQVIHIMCIDGSANLLWNQQLFIPAGVGTTPTHYGYQTIETTTGEFVTVGKRNGEFPNTSNENVYIAKFSPNTSSVKDIKVRNEKAYIFPNPASTSVLIKDSDFSGAKQATLTVVDLMGKVVLTEQHADAFLINLAVDQLSSGTYLVYKDERFIDKMQIVK